MKTVLAALLTAAIGGPAMACPNWQADPSFRDAVLLINAPDGQWYHTDDTSGTDPAITFLSPQQGPYDIWIGAYGGGRGIPGQPIITER